MKTGDRIGTYVIESKLGQGGMGVVWAARREPDGTPVVIKALASLSEAPTEAAELRARLRREAKVLLGLRHEGIVEAIESFEQSGDLFLVLEYVAGETFDRWMERTPSLPLRLATLRRIGEALAWAHERGVIHRDLKPQNVVVRSSDAQPKILDFGLARALDSTRLTQTGMVFGTLAYMAPEQARGLPLDARVDRYAFALMLAEALGCRAMFRLREAAPLYRALVSDRPTEIDGWLPDDLREPLSRMLAKDREERTSDWSEILAFVERLAGEGEALDARLTAARSRSDADPRRSVRLPRIARPEIEGPVERLVGRLASGRGGFLLLLGAPGSGKTHALEDVEERLAAASIRGERLAFAEGGLPRIALWSRAADATRPPGEIEATFDLASQEANDPSPSFLDEIERRATQGPTFLSVDDVPLAPPSDFEWLGRLLDLLDRAPLLLVCTGDASVVSVPAESRDAWEALLRRMAGREGTERIVLPRLPVDAIAEGLRESGVPAAIAANLAAACGGNPGTLRQLLDRWSEGGELPRVIDTAPGHVIRRLARRLEALDKVARQTIRIVVAANGEIGSADLASRLGLPKLAVSARLAELDRAHGWLRVDQDRVVLTQPFLGALPAVDDPAD